MSIVGFGDFYPKTHAGRFIITIAIVFGLTLVSITIVSLDNLKKYEANEFNVKIFL
jgi:hypothetical protein